MRGPTLVCCARVGDIIILLLSFVGLGFHSLSPHCCAAFISSLSLSGIGSTSNKHLVNASISRFNSLVSLVVSSK